MSADVAPMLSEPEARRLTQRISLLLDAAAGTLDKLASDIRAARDGRADLALGYSSWADYAAAEFGPHTAGLTASIRRELVSSLSADLPESPALSTRQIAPAVGTDYSTVSRDRQVLQRATPEPEAEPEPTPPFDPLTGEVLDEWAPILRADARNAAPAPEPAKVLGLDGKTYTRPEPSPRAPSRRSLVDTARDAGQELRKAVERLERIAADDRLARNKEEVAAHLRHHLAQAIKVCQDLDNRLN